MQARTPLPLETDRIVLRPLVDGDAPFILELVNTPSWLHYIGDRNIRTLDEARSYIRTGPQESYRKYGFGLWSATLKPDGVAIGLCGLLKRDYLDDFDIGFAFLPEYEGRGYAYESASAVLEHAKTALALPRIAAIVAPGNERSMKLLGRLGFDGGTRTRFTEDGEEMMLFLHTTDRPSHGS